MAIKIQSIKCPECGADLQCEEGRNKIFCSYCGVPIVITNENEKTYIHRDEAKIRAAEIERELKLKELSMQEKREQRDSTIRILKIKISIILGIICFLSIGITFLFEDDEDLSLLSFGIGMLAFVLLAYMWLFTAMHNDEKK